MPSSIVKAKVTLPFSSGLATDVAVNTLWFEQTAAHTLSDLAQDIINFYIVQPVGPLNPNRLSNYLASYVSRAANAARVDLYDGLAGPPNPPLYTQSFTLPAAVVGAHDLPSEVAATLTFDGGPPVTHRNRGRIFLGSLNDTTIEPGPNGLLYLHVSFRENVLKLAQDLAAAAAADDFDWIIHSAFIGETVVTRASMDDAFDTIRSRGVKARGRTYVNV